MIEDKLSTEQRIRLEALAQATASSMGVPTTPEKILSKAEKFEIYIRTGRTVSENG